MGILSSFLGGSDSNQRKENPDLMGSARCAIGTRDDSGFKINSCDMRCPMWHYCSRGSSQQW